MTRRDANWLVLRATATAGAASFLSGWLSAQPAAHTHHAPPDPHSWDSYQPKYFSADEFRALDSFTAILIPTDDTPGAKEAHVASFIDFVVNAAAEFAPEVQTQWRDATHWLQAENFNQLDDAGRLALITAMAAPERDHAKSHPGFSHYQLIKEMTVRAFYTSRIGLIEVLQYQGNAYLTEFPACTHPEHHHL